MCDVWVLGIHALWDHELVSTYIHSTFAFMHAHTHTHTHTHHTHTHLQRLNFFGGPSYSNEEMVMMVAEESMHEEDRIVVRA